MTSENKDIDPGRVVLSVFAIVAIIIVVGMITLGIKTAQNNEALIKMSEKYNPVVVQCALNPPSNESNTYLELCKWALTLDKDGIPK